MQKLMVKVQDEARATKQLMHGDLPKLEKQLAETTGLFKGKERKALQEKITGIQQEIDRRMGAAGQWQRQSLAPAGAA